ncbi:hypothetical protein KY319_00495 [Candidatus Woesearchaeota archaeon]|nr:hypothetical protein [Candidatus Woesearchaeota archaeon]
MKTVLSFFVFLLILVSASAVIDVQINNQKFPNSITNVHPYNNQNIFTISQGTPQGFTAPPTSTKGAITFKRDNDAPTTAEYYFFNTQAPGSIPQTPTGGAIIYNIEETGNTPLIAIVILISIASLFLILRGASTPQTKITFVAVTLIVLAFAGMKLSQPTGYTVQEYQPQEITPSQYVVNAFTLTWTKGGPITFLPEGQPPTSYQCSDGINNDFEDGLIDCADPGCHSDGNVANAASCVPTDNLEQDMLEYDHAPVVDNQIDVYDVVNWIEYYNGLRTNLVHCTSATCTNQIGTANCVGSVDPNKDSLINTADMTYLQSAELNNTDSRTIPTIVNSICKNPS